MKLWKKLLPVALVLMLAVLILPGKAEAAMEGCYVYTVADGKATIIDVDDTLSGDVVIPSTLGGYPVAAIGNKAFHSNQKITSLVIPDGIVSIGRTAFFKCDALTSITFPASLETVEPCAFEQCKALTSIDFGTGIISIGEAAFRRCEALTSVQLPDSVTTIGADAFRICSALTEITIPKNVTSIGNNAFSQCSALTRISVDPENTCYSSDSCGVLFNIDKTVLLAAPCALKDVYTVPSSVTTIRDWAFLQCKAVTQIRLPEGVAAIGEGAFYECRKLTAATVPNSVISLGQLAFAFCSKLETATIGNGVTSIREEAFTNCLNLKEITIPESVLAIEKSAYHGCDLLTDVLYQGTRTQWDAITIGEDNEPLLSANIRCLADKVPGDMDGDGEKTTDDAVYLLLSVMFGTEDYPVPAGTDLDFDGDGEVNTNDAVYLLLHVMFGAEDYPLCPDNDTVMTYEAFMAAEVDSTVCIETYVQATESWWEDTITAYAQSQDGAYYLYMMACSEEDAAKLVPGTKIRVTGEKAEWCGEVEILNATFEFVDAAPYIAEPIDATNMTEAELKANMNKLATFKSLTVEKVERKNPEGADDLYLTLKNGEISMDFQVEIYLTDENSDVYKTAIDLKEGDVVNVTGFLYWYEGPCPHVTAITKTAA